MATIPATSIPKFPSTTTPKTNNPKEMAKCLYDIVQKVNNLSAAMTSNVTSTNSNVSTLSATVSQIITSGSNSNGSYTQFADGTMICRQSTATITIIGGPYGGWYEQTLDWTFPVPFVGSPQVPAPGFMRTVAGLAAFTWIGLISSSGTRFVANSLDNSTQGYFLATATGRWK